MSLEHSLEFLALEAPLLSIVESFEQYKEHVVSEILSINRVKSGIFGQTAILGQPHCLFHISKIGIQNKLT